MNSNNMKNIDFAPENVILNFRDNNVKPPLIRKTIQEISQEGYPLNKNGEKIKLLSVKLLDGFINDIDHTLIESVTYHEATIDRNFDNEEYEEF